jgi:succinate-acetate transporter protein
MNRGVMVMFFSLTILFFLLALADATGSPAIQRIAGYEGILSGLGAIYVGTAQLVNEVWGRSVLPLGTIE